MDDTEFAASCKLVVASSELRFHASSTEALKALDTLSKSYPSIVERRSGDEGTQTSIGYSFYPSGNVFWKAYARTARVDAKIEFLTRAHETLSASDYAEFRRRWASVAGAPLVNGKAPSVSLAHATHARVWPPLCEFLEWALSLPRRRRQS